MTAARKLFVFFLISLVVLVLLNFGDERDFFEGVIPASNVPLTTQEVEGITSKSTIGQVSEDVAVDENVEVFVLKKDLGENPQNEMVYFVSYPHKESLAEGETLVIYARGVWEETAIIKLDSRFFGAFVHDLNKDGKEELFVKTIGGKTVYSHPLSVDSQKITKIPVISSDGRSFDSFSTTSGLEAKDWDGDGKDEILVYYRFYPPEKKRTVEVYKFDGEKFTFFKEYDEETEDLFL